MSKYPTSRLALLGALGGLLALQQLFTVGGTSLLGGAVNNAAHVPLFAAVTLLVARLLRYPHPAMLLVVCLAIAVASEALQLLTGRHASLQDIGLDLLGILSVLGGLVVTGTLSHGASWRASGTRTWPVVALLLAVFTAMGPLRVLLAYNDRDRVFPSLFEPGAWRQAPLLVSGSRLRTVTAPERWNAYAGRPVLEVTWANERYPGIVLREVVPQWREFDVLAVDLFIPQGSPGQAGGALTLTASVRYATDPPAASWVWRNVEPGPQRVYFALDELLVESADIASLVLHADQADAGRTFYFGRVLLLPRVAPDDAIGALSIGATAVKSR